MVYYIIYTTRELDSILRVQGSNFTNDMWCNQHGNIDWRFLYIPRLIRLRDYLGELKLVD